MARLARPFCATLALVLACALACSKGETRQGEGVVGQMVASGLIQIDSGEVPGGAPMEYEIEPELLAGLRSGDRVRFTIEMKGGRFHITQIRKQEGP
jgi:hypothetical protein